MAPLVRPAVSGHAGPISGVAVHGDTIATAGYDNQIYLWNWRRRTIIARGSHDHLVNHCSFSPDGRLLISASSDHSVRLWSVPEMKLLAIYNWHSDDAERSVFSPSGTMFVTCSRDKTARVYQPEIDRLLTIGPLSADINSVAWSADERELTTVDDAGEIWTWDTTTGAARARNGTSAADADIVLPHPDGRLIVGNDAGQITVLTDGQPRIWSCHHAVVKCLCLSPNGRHLLSLSYDGMAKLWRLTDDDLALEREYEIPNLVWARSAVFLDSEFVGLGTFGSSYALLNVLTGCWDLEKIAPDLSLNAVTWHCGSAYSVGDSGIVYKDDQEFARAPSLCNFIRWVGDRLIAGGHDGAIYDVMSGDILHRHSSPLNCSELFEHDGSRYLVVGTFTGEALLFIVEIGRCRFVRSVRVQENAIKGAAHHEGLLLTTSPDGEVNFLSLPELRPVRKVDDAHHSIVNGCAATRDGFVTVSRDLNLAIWQTDGAYELWPSPHVRSVRAVAVHLERNIVATGAYDGTIGLFSLDTRSWLDCQRPTTAGISSLCSTPAGFIATSYDGALYAIELRQAA